MHPRIDSLGFENETPNADPPYSSDPSAVWTFIVNVGRNEFVIQPSCDNYDQLWVQYKHNGRHRESKHGISGPLEACALIHHAAANGTLRGNTP
jgi:hypothetical protein